MYECVNYNRQTCSNQLYVCVCVCLFLPLQTTPKAFSFWERGPYLTKIRKHSGTIITALDQSRAGNGLLAGCKAVTDEFGQTSVLSSREDTSRCSGGVCR